MRVLFVCSGNAYRSPLAEALLKRFRPEIEADSAGTHPAGFISGEARRFLAREKAEKYLKHAPEGIDEKSLRDYDLIVAMENEHRKIILKRCPECADRIVVWGIEDPYFLPEGYAEKIFEQIKSKVLKLVEAIAKNEAL